MEGGFYKRRFLQLKGLAFILRLCPFFALKLLLLYLFYEMTLEDFLNMFLLGKN